MKNLEKIKNELAKNNIDKDVQNDFMRSLSESNDSDIELISNIFKEYPEHIKTFMDIFQKKQSALQNKDSEKWTQIMQEEKELLQKISKQ